MAESIVFGTATEILKKIGSLVGGELSLLWNLDSDLRRLQGTMSAIKAVLLDAETKQTQNHQLRDWLGKLKDVFYDAEDKLPESICQLHKLETFTLYGCYRLKKLPRNIRRMISLRHVEITTKERYLRENGIGCLSSLRFLYLSGCGNLVRLFEGMQGLTSLRRLQIESCSLTSLPYSIKYLKRLEKVMISNCQELNLKMEFQGEDKDNLCLGVRKFIIEGLPSLVDLPQLILQGSANTLQCIMIEDCPKLVELPEWLQNLTSLQTLEILNCRSLSCLPEGMQRLTVLRQLKIQGCPALSESCRRDQSKIAHVREVHLDE
ncbi:hypothetical protein Pint_16955 [Pistacia integerrima]|uniref:Uncharacterized protein n=1 Tax=Pistacia integerrima TaxID=434235 RepID=A0ACC0Z9V7_9ROSI|nr:hypothetical protein Pint_16955 [Pistacia integerrima]